MITTLIILLVLFVSLGVIVIALLLSPKKGGSVNLKTDKNVTIRVVKDGKSESRLVIEYDSYEQLPSDVYLYPEIFEKNNPLPPDALDREFWQKWSAIDTLPPTEREELVKKAVDHSIIPQQHASLFINGTSEELQEVYNNSMQDGAEDMFAHQVESEQQEGTIFDI